MLSNHGNTWWKTEMGFIDAKEQNKRNKKLDEWAWDRSQIWNEVGFSPMLEVQEPTT